ncbi:hypothetical protein R1flu_020771 [Riccia fluitans]|uniref:Uncharacterized protein n=1 Tax=Riccia fluitans TaxID=41844 RepID=A0ABD1ZMH0_9MARC
MAEAGVRGADQENVFNLLSSTWELDRGLTGFKKDLIRLAISPWAITIEGERIEKMPSEVYTEYLRQKEREDMVIDYLSWLEKERKQQWALAQLDKVLKVMQF